MIAPPIDSPREISGPVNVSQYSNHGRAAPKPDHKGNKRRRRRQGADQSSETDAETDADVLGKDEPDPGQDDDSHTLDILI